MTTGELPVPPGLNHREGEFTTGEEVGLLAADGCDGGLGEYLQDLLALEILGLWLPDLAFALYKKKFSGFEVVTAAIAALPAEETAPPRSPSRGIAMLLSPQGNWCFRQD